LDAKVGKGNYTVFLTADHGAAHNANYLIDHNIPAGFWGESIAGLNKVLEDKYKAKGLILSFNNYQVNFNYAAIKKDNISEDALKNDCIQYLQKQQGVAYAIDMQHVQTANIPEDLRERIINGYNPERSGTIQIILKPGWYGGHGGTGTTHGTWNPYDAHIPLVFMGWGIKHGSLTRETHMTDIAATVAALLHIQAPNGNIGKTISEVLK
jgi:arylsulfatase A-like enzyme